MASLSLVFRAMTVVGTKLTKKKTVIHKGGIISDSGRVRNLNWRCNQSTQNDSVHPKPRYKGRSICIGRQNTKKSALSKESKRMIMAQKIHGTNEKT